MNGVHSERGTESGRPTSAEIEREVERLPEVLEGHLVVADAGTVVGAYVVVRREAMLERVARDVRSVIGDVAGVDLALDQILVVEQDLIARPDGSGDHAKRLERPDAGLAAGRTPCHVHRTAQEPASSPAVVTDHPPPNSLDAAAARVLRRRLAALSDSSHTPVPLEGPAWGELIVSREPTGEDAISGQSTDAPLVASQPPVQGCPALRHEGRVDDADRTETGLSPVEVQDQPLQGTFERVSRDPVEHAAGDYSSSYPVASHLHAGATRLLRRLRPRRRST